jgi:recombination protein RecR
MEYTKELSNLIEEFRKFPSIGPKSAQRMAFALLKKTPEQVEKFVRVLRDAKEKIQYCSKCFNLTSNPICEICLDPRRHKYQICVVESVKDLAALERTHDYHGLYHVLGGVISPLDGIGADDLNISSLLQRLTAMQDQNSGFDHIEIILAISLSTEGEATMLYIKRLLELQFQLKLSNLEIKLTRLAHGLPVGADLDYTDEITLSKALESRVLA